MQDAWRAYLEMALGLTEAPRKRAQQVAGELVNRGGATAAQLQGLVEDLMSTGVANREALTNIVRFEVDRALGRVGLATADEVADLNGRVRDLERQLRQAQAGAAGSPGSGTPAQVDEVTLAEPGPIDLVPPAKKLVPPAKKAVAKKAVARKVAPDAMPAAAETARKAAPPASNGSTPVKATTPGAAPKPAPGKAGPAKATPSKAGPAKPAPGEAGPAKAAPGKVAPGKAVPAKVAPSKAGPAKAGPGEAGPAKAKAEPATPAGTAAAPTAPVKEAAAATELPPVAARKAPARKSLAQNDDTGTPTAPGDTAAKRARKAAKKPIDPATPEATP